LGINIYKLCDMSGYIRNRNTYSVKYRSHEDSNVTPTHTQLYDIKQERCKNMGISYI